jgi:excisionase family DNA binding protein
MKLDDNTNYNLSVKSYSKAGSEKLKNKSELIFHNLIWLTTKEAAVYLRKSVNSIHTLVSRKKLRARKFSNRLYFNKKELDYLIETSQLRGG